ncbi:MAG: phage Gp37/Gp68 family protein [Phycisphaerae bacterium]|nr:phage Gp37/Gp68 family protein [Phycisphaerae bacterium]
MLLSRRCDAVIELAGESALSKIEWTDQTWNPATGCTKISPGCKHCYAETMAIRLQAMGQKKYRTGFQLATHPETLNIPLRTTKPTTWFVNSMSDLFHEEMPIEYIRHVFDVMARADWHRFQILTKRSGRLRQLAAELPWPQHVWMGVSVENNDYLWRIDDLLATNAAVKFLSIEPLLGPLPDLDLTGINWVIVGGESGPKARPIQEEWVVEILRQCQAKQVPFFFKQWGGVKKKGTGRELLGRVWDETPS